MKLDSKIDKRNESYKSSQEKKNAIFNKID
jgi:hypothetical protein